MEEKQLIEGLTEALRGGGYTKIERRSSSRSVTLSAHKGRYTAVVHIEDREAVTGPRSVINAEVPDQNAIAVLPRVPSLEGMSGSGGGEPAAKPPRRRPAR